MIAFDHVNTLSGTSSIRIYKEEEYVAYLTGALTYRKPNMMAIAVFGPFGTTVMKVLIADGSLEIYIPKKDTLYKTDLGIPFLLPDSKILKDYEASVTETDNDYILGLYSSSDNNYTLSSKYFFDKEPLRNYKIEKYNSDNPIFTIMIDKATEHNLPSEFSITAGKSRFEIKANTFTVNADISGDAFKHMRARSILPIQDFLRALEPNQ